MLSAAEPFLGQQMHPTTIIAAYRQALDDILTITKEKIRWWSGKEEGSNVSYFVLCVGCVVVI